MVASCVFLLYLLLQEVTKTTKAGKSKKSLGCYLRMFRVFFFLKRERKPFFSLLQKPEFKHNEFESKSTFSSLDTFFK